MMAMFMDKRGQLAKLHKSRSLTFHQIQDWGLGTIIVSTDPDDIAVPLCVGYVVSNGTFCVTRITNVKYDPMVGYRLVMSLDGDQSTINVTGQTPAAHSLIGAELLLKNPTDLGSSAAFQYAHTPLGKDLAFHLGINAGVRLFGDVFDSMLLKASKRSIVPVINNDLYQELMRFEERSKLHDAYHIGRVIGYYTALWNLQLLGEGIVPNAMLSRIVCVRAFSALTESLDYQMAQIAAAA